jgi:hypothetical protein
VESPPRTASREEEELAAAPREHPLCGPPAGEERAAIAREHPLCGPPVEQERAAIAREHPLCGPPGRDGERVHALAAISAEFPGWFAWPGVATLLYARRPRTSPPMVVRSATLDGLREAIEQAERERGLR